jgi:hypothetical protein
MSWRRVCCRPNKVLYKFQESMLHGFVTFLQIIYIDVWIERTDVVHRLHDELTDVFQHFLACFIKSESVKGLTESQLKELDVACEDLVGIGVCQWEVPSALQTYKTCHQYFHRPSDRTIIQCDEHLILKHIQPCKMLSVISLQSTRQHFFYSILFLFIYKWTGTDNRRNAYMSLPLYNNIYTWHRIRMKCRW